MHHFTAARTEQTIPFLGAWALVEYSVTPLDSDIKKHPFGRDVDGLLLYGNSHMSVQIMRRCTLGQHTSGTGADTLIAAQAQDFMCYCGRYTYDVATSVVTHIVEQSVAPTWIGTAQRRRVVQLQDTLILQSITPIEIAGERVQASLLWRQHGAASPRDVAGLDSVMGAPR